MSRMKGVEVKHAPWSVRLIYWFSKRRVGHVPEERKILAHDPLLLRQRVRMTRFIEASNPGLELASGRGVDCRAQTVVISGVRRFGELDAIVRSADCMVHMAWTGQRQSNAAPAAHL